MVCEKTVLENDLLDDYNEAYLIEVRAIVEKCKVHNRYDVKYIQNLDVETEIVINLPAPAMVGLKMIDGLTGHIESDIVAVLVALQFSKCERIVKAFYNHNPGVLNALRELGKLQHGTPKGFESWLVE